ncbi:protein RKD5 isoform X2 [Juglans microcarpa x Juglans regia]|uniref:protein RKD5 isoform X2 n=1 Tax=Juglans microcarpa x Juglans regia TaxID=2249226 RepID=UPI001B7E5640|nr:protein RKD5 isoform X2 [Juglans microcarpa x Juglans regia]
MDSSDTHFLKALLVFQNTVNEELIRSMHVYQLENGKENEVERGFLFSVSGSYMEIEANPALFLLKFRPSEVFEGLMNGFWLCIFAYHADRSPHLTCIPSLLSIARNPKLKSVPTLSRDLQIILELGCRREDREPSQFPEEETCQENYVNYHQSRKSSPILRQDLNCLPYPASMSELSEDQHKEQCSTGIVDNKKKRAASEHIASIALSDLAKYFDLPITEASRNLKVGLTVLKKKCRELGIPRWPHRKIKSLDGLIQDLQEEAKRQQQENEAAAMVVAKRRRMLESEKENIERKPFMELQTETKRFRQDVFKRRHRARALRNHGLSISNNQLI